MITSTSVPSSATPTLVADAASQFRYWLAVTNQGTATVFYSIDGTSDVTIGSGAKPGIPLAPGITHFFSRNSAATDSNIAPVYVVQQSGSAQTVSIQVL